MAQRLFWRAPHPLTFTLRRNGKLSRIAVPVELVADDNSIWDLAEAPVCARAEFYPGFEKVFSGSHACAFEKRNEPGTVLLRIDSF